MQTLPLTLSKTRSHVPRWLLRSLARSLAAGLVALMSSAGLETQQRKLIFQLGARTGEAASNDCLDLGERWIEFDSDVTGKPVRLHALWLAHADADAPVLLYLHGARWDVSGSVQRMQQLRALGFSVLGVDYRGFGRSSPDLPS
ncbi:MAG: hypothetical protein ABL900_21735, partial [Burkholderiaceae bacterium]